MAQTLEVHTNDEFCDAIGAVNRTTSDDTAPEIGMIIISPGKYDVGELDGVGVIHPLTIRGTGATAGDTYVKMRAVAQTNGRLNLENLTMVNVTAEQATIYMDDATELMLTNVNLLNQAPDHATVLLDGARALMKNVTIKHADPDTEGIAALNGASINIEHGALNGVVMRDVCHLKFDVMALNGSLAGDTFCEFKGRALHLQRATTGLADVSLNNDCVLEVTNLNVVEGHHVVETGGSAIKTTTSNLDEQHVISVYTDNLLGITLSGADVYSSDPDDTAGVTAYNARLPKPSPDAVADQRGFDDLMRQLENFPDETAIPVTVSGPASSAPVTAVADVTSSDQLAAMVGLTQLKTSIKKFINMARFNQQRAAQGLPVIEASYHSLFLGNPGTGKTTVARLVGKIMYEQHILPQPIFVEAARQDLVAEYVGMTAPKTTKLLESALGGVLFIDEAYSLAGGDSNNYGQEAIDTILKFMEDPRTELMIIFAGYHDQMQDLLNMNPGLASRIPNVFQFEDYSPSEIATIGELQLEAQQFQFDHTFYRQTVSRAYQHAFENSNGRWIRNFNEQLIQTVAENYMTDPDNHDISTILNADIEELMGGDQPARAAKVTELLAQLDQLTGLLTVKTFIHDLVAR